MNRDFRQSISKVTVCKSEPETEAFGLRLSDVLEAGDVIALTGDLGAGKTTLTKAIARGLGVRETVTSPTFMIIKEYRSGRLPLYHFDVYRLGSAEDLYDIGGDEYFDGDGVCIVEWADIIREVIPEDAVWINLEYGDGPEERIYTIQEE